MSRPSPLPTTIEASSPDDFIEVGDAALEPALCATWVKRFRDSAEARPGQVGGGVHSDLKDSRDLTISGRPEWRDVEMALNAAVFKAMLAYLRRYPYTLIAPLMLEVPDADVRRMLALAEHLESAGHVELARGLG